MAGKKKKKEEEQESTETKMVPLAKRLQTMDKLCEQATKNGLALAGRITNPEVAKRLELRYIPTPSPDINRAVGGGLPITRATIIAGAPDSGKTGLVLETIACNQKVDPDFVAVWIETEHSIDQKTLVNTYHIDLNRFIVFFQNSTSAAEGIGDLLATILRSDVNPNIVVINSLKMLVPQDEIGKPMTKETIGKQARLNSALMKKLIPMFSESNAAFVMIQDLTTEIGKMYGDPLGIAGGWAIRYASSLTLDLRKLSIQDSDPIKRDEGLKIKLSVKKNHCITDRYPYVAVEYFVEFGHGIEKMLPVLAALIDMGAIEKAGAWLRMRDANGELMPDWSWNGKAAYKADMVAHPEKFDTLLKMAESKIITQLSDEEVKEIEQQEALDANAVKEDDKEADLLDQATA